MQRTRTTVLLASVLLVLAGFGAALAEEGHKDHGEHHGQMTVRGEVLDMGLTDYVWLDNDGGINVKKKSILIARDASGDISPVAKRFQDHCRNS